MTKEYIIKELNLVPLIGEGGMWTQPYRAQQILPKGVLGYEEEDRPICSTIYYMLTPDSFSCMHRLTIDENWFYHEGPAVKLLLIGPEGKAEVKVLGTDLEKGERPQISVPRGTWQGALMAGEGEYTLMSTSTSPAYLDCDYTKGSFEELEAAAKDEETRELLRKLTGELRYL